MHGVTAGCVADAWDVAAWCGADAWVVAAWCVAEQHSGLEDGSIGRALRQQVPLHRCCHTTAVFFGLVSSYCSRCREVLYT